MRCDLDLLKYRSIQNEKLKETPLHEVKNEKGAFLPRFGGINTVPEY